MTIDKTIRDALLPFGDPAQKNIYTGKSRRYYTFNYDSYGECFGDDSPVSIRYAVMVHFFAPHTFDSVERISQTCTAIYNAGGTWPDVVDATDGDGQHFVFECEFAGGVSDGNI